MFEPGLGEPDAPRTARPESSAPAEAVCSSHLTLAWLVAGVEVLAVLVQCSACRSHTPGAGLTSSYAVGARYWSTLP